MKLKIISKNGKIFHVLDLEESISLKWPHYPKKCDPYENIQNIFHRTRINYPKIYMEP